MYIQVNFDKMNLNNITNLACNMAFVLTIRSGRANLHYSECSLQRKVFALSNHSLYRSLPML